MRKTTNLACVVAILLGSAGVAPAANPSAADQQLNYRCLLGPDLQLCEGLYRKAMHDSAPAAWSLRQAYKHYARYLTGNHALTNADQQYLKANHIDLPNDLTPLQISGLHNAINDPSLQGNAATSNVTNYLLRAEEANIYCGLQPCKNPPAS
ncbi:MAG TPA: hypothetical protein VMU22_07480 [Rhizomicrobium sp.]|nr:hypothetical protein [Rhizomicrobium sp.]